MSFKYSTQKASSTNIVDPKTTKSFQDFYNLEIKPIRISTEKNGKTFIPSLFISPIRKAENVSEISMAVFDVDQEAHDDVIGLEEIEDVLLDMGLEHAVYTSYSNTAECPRFRVLIPFSRSTSKKEYPFIMSALVEDLDEFLGYRFSKIIDRCWKNEFSRCYYTFTSHPDNLKCSTSFYNPGKPLDVDEVKLRQCTYGQDFFQKNTNENFKKGINISKNGRSYELNRILCGMYRGANEEQIVNRLLEFDDLTHAKNEYFRDKQYSRNRARPGETAERARFRSCKMYVKSHISWLKRKINADFEIKNIRGVNVGAVDAHDARIEIYKVEHIVKNDKESTKLSCKIVSGKHAGAIFWHTLFGDGYSAGAIKVSLDFLERARIASKIDMQFLKNLGSIIGMNFKARIKRVKGTNGYADQNQIGIIYIDQ